MNLFLVCIILFLAIFSIKMSNKVGIPSLLIFILIGMIFGYFNNGFENYQLAQDFSTLALLIIIFQGGFSTNFYMARSVAKESITLSFAGTIITGLLTGLFCHYVLHFDLLEGLLLGAIVSSTDFSCVSNILKSQKLNLKMQTAPLLELESGSNDPIAYTMTFTLISALLGNSISSLKLITAQVVFGVVIGFLVAFAFMKIVEVKKFDGAGLFIIFILATAFFAFSFSEFIKGNGYLAVYILGIYIGNKEFKGKRESVFFLDGLTALMSVGLFFILGFLSDPAKVVKSLPIAFVIMLFMFIISRPLAVFGLMSFFKSNRDQKLIISVAGIRGAAAIAFAILTVNSGVVLKNDIFHIVFAICLLSTALQGYLLPVMCKKLNFMDPSDTVFKNFNDYQDRSDIGFITTLITEDSHLVNQPISEINPTFNLIVAKIVRNGKTIVPKGSTVLKAGDKIVIGGEHYFDKSGYQLTEFTIPKKHEWIGKKVRDLNIGEDELIVMIQDKDGKIVVPNGNTQIFENDKIIKMTNK